MQLDEMDALIAKIDTLYYTSFLLRFLEECGGIMCRDGYPNTILRECRWYVLQQQLEELGALTALVSALPVSESQECP